MGEVYRARDDRLSRDVAVKVLRPELSRDPDWLRRFEQEARAAGALNHPNILAIYDLGVHAGCPYIVSELLEGETLRARLGGAPLPLRKARDYALQTAKGLAAAHQKGIVHRDLKPENIFVTTDGRVKILDFGLAKLTERNLGDEPQEVTPTASLGTEPGVMLGTVGYMSPEQVLGRPSDHRSDIFSFGAILYEMLTGQRAFRRGSAVETMNAILKEEPPELTDVAPNLPPDLERVVRHCLEKGPEERFQSASDLAFDLGALPEEAGRRREPPVVRPRPSSWRTVAAAIGLALLGAVMFFAGRKTAPVSNAPLPIFRQLTFRQGTISGARFGPDGQTIIYSAAWDGKPAELFTTRADGPESRPLGFGTAGLLAVSFASELAITSGCEFTWAECQGTLALVRLAGGAPRQVLENVHYADWSPDGKTLTVVRAVEGLYRLEFPAGRVLYETKGWIGHPRFSPKGDLIAFLDYPVLGNNAGAVAVVDLAGKKKTLSGKYRNLGGLAWHPSGEEIWFNGRPTGEWSSVNRVTLSGRETTILRPPGGLQIQDISREGIVLFNRYDGRSRLIFGAGGLARERDLAWLDWSTAADISTDGSNLLFYEWGRGAPTTYLRKTDGSDAVRLGEGKALALSPDGKWALVQQETPSPHLALLPTGPGEKKSLAHSGIADYYAATWFPDGKRILFVGEGQDGVPRSYVQDVASGEMQAVAAGLIAVLVSPDAKRLAAYGPDGAGYVYPVEGGKPASIPGLVPGDTLIQWSADGRSLFVRGPQDPPMRIFRVDLASGRRELWKELTPSDPVGNVGISSDQRAVLLTPDGRFLVYTYWTALSTLFLAEGLK
jgi:Tol biopolymer transport system component